MICADEKARSYAVWVDCPVWRFRHHPESPDIWIADHAIIFFPKSCWNEKIPTAFRFSSRPHSPRLQNVCIAIRKRITLSHKKSVCIPGKTHMYYSINGIHNIRTTNVILISGKRGGYHTNSTSFKASAQNDMCTWLTYISSYLFMETLVTTGCRPKPNRISKNIANIQWWRVERQVSCYRNGIYPHFVVSVDHLL